ncbi:hypothetical protein F2Q68_00014614 [Brassica cretica]|uniref:Uncharacterized protein n=1 Tax=Brassica cretica TaxID=69181 RepID=A0A8S9HIX9_BRACR|nr:hypothetical protein F2Q68_00014614 [Brassica cretica]
MCFPAALEIRTVTFILLNPPSTIYLECDLHARPWNLDYKKTGRVRHSRRRKAVATEERRIKAMRDQPCPLHVPVKFFLLFKADTAEELCCLSCSLAAWWSFFGCDKAPCCVPPGFSGKRSVNQARSEILGRWYEISGDYLEPVTSRGRDNLRECSKIRNIGPGT